MPIVNQPFLYSQKDSSSIEEKMFLKVTLPSTLIFSAKDVCTINLTVSCLPIFVFKTVWEVFLYETVGYVIVT